MKPAFPGYSGRIGIGNDAGDKIIFLSDRLAEMSERGSFFTPAGPARVFAFPQSAAACEVVAAEESPSFWDRLHGLIDRMEQAAEDRHKRRLERAVRQAVERPERPRLPYRP